MNNDHQKIWETYTQSWKANTASEKRDLYRASLSEHCVYTDPLTQTKGWQQLEEYMLDFHKQIPGGHFETFYFSNHHNKSMAKWHMKDGNGATLSEGVSVGEYDEEGRLISMTGFYET